MTGENGQEKGPEQSGPISLPDDAQCSNCHYSQLIPVIDPKTRTPMLNHKQRICRRMPPTTVLIQQGQSVGQIGMFPVVPEDAFCYEWDEREGAEVIPTGLTVVNDD